MANIENTPHATYRVRYRNLDGEERSKTFKTEAAAKTFKMMVEETFEAARLREAEERMIAYEKPGIQDKPAHPLHQADFHLQEGGERMEPKIVKVTPLQMEIIKDLRSTINGVEASSDIAARIKVRPQAVGATLTQLAKRGVVENLAPGVWGYLDDKNRRFVEGPATKKPKKQKPKPKAEVLGTPQKPLRLPGDMFELIGKTPKGQHLVRSMDDHIVYAIVEL